MTNALAAAPVREPIPVWVKLVAVLVALPTLVFSILVTIAVTGLIDGVTADNTSHSSATLAAGQAVQVDVSQSGVSVVAGPDGQVSLDDFTSVRAPTRALAHRALDANASRLEQTPTGVHVIVSGSPFGIGISRSARDVVVHVPASAPVKVTVAAGGADISGLSGDLDLAAQTGGFSLRNMTISGQVRASARTGGIAVGRGTRMAGGTLDLTAGSGGIDVQLPADTNARYDLSAGAGGIDVVLPGAIERSAAGSNKSLSGVLGDGSGGQIRAHTATGGVSLQVRGTTTI
jgi:hypothetical protein